jgi:DNA-binding protein Fis
VAKRPGGLPSLDLGELERLAIAEALRQCDGNNTRAAGMLGIALKTLDNQLVAGGDSPAQQ